MTRPRSRLKSALFAAISLLISTLLCFVLVEIALRTIRPPAINEYLGEIESPLARKVGWGGAVDGQGHYLCDSPHSLSKPKTTFRVLLLGDSILDCNTTNQLLQDTIPRLLQEELGAGFEIINLAAGGWGNDQELLAYEEAGRQYSPDLVLLFFTPANDLFNNAAMTAVGAEKEKPYFMVDPEGKLELHEVKSRNTVINWLRRRFARTEIKRRLALLRQSRYWARLFPFGIESEPYVHISSFVTPLSPRLERSWTVTQAILTRLDESARRDHAELALVYVPTGIPGIHGPCEFPPEFPDRCVGYGPSEVSVRCERNFYRLDIYQPYRMLAEFSRRTAIPLISNLKELEPYRLKHRLLAPDCLHLNRAGASLLARAAAVHIRSVSRSALHGRKYK